MRLVQLAATAVILVPLYGCNVSTIHPLYEPRWTVNLVPLLGVEEGSNPPVERSGSVCGAGETPAPQLLETDLSRTALMLIRLETPADYAAVHEVNRLAFGQETEGRLVDELRDGGYARLSLVAEHNAQIVGHLLFSDLPIHTLDGIVKSLALAPLAVAPGFQRQGIGSALVREGLKLCQERGHRIVVVLGHPEYYPRFGFSPKLAEPLVCPYSGPALMALELVPGALQGVSGELQYAPPFQAF